MAIFNVLLLLVGILNLNGQSTASLEEQMKWNDFSIKVFQGKDDEWETVVINHSDQSDWTKDADVMQKVIHRDGKKLLVSQICLRGQFNESNRAFPPLRFHSKGGRNIVVNEKRTSVRRINEMTEGGFGGVLTDRPLRDGEMFEVRIDNMISQYSQSLGIGVSWKDPESVVYDHWMTHDTIMLYNNKICQSTSALKLHYGPSLSKLKIGDKVGVMRKNTGDLHFFVNGMDLGIAASNVTSPVYGALDLHGNVIAATIV